MFNITIAAAVAEQPSTVHPTLTGKTRLPSRHVSAGRETLHGKQAESFIDKPLCINKCINNVKYH